MTKPSTRFACPLLIVAASSLCAVSHSADSRLTPASRADLCVTEGALEQLPGHRLSVAVPKMRAYLAAATPQIVEARFTYLGSTGNEARLGSGELRRQFGLKLRAQDACNLVYAMWRIEPESKLVVSIKSNPGQRTSAECANRGYKNIKPARSKPVSVLHPGDTHSLRAEMHAADLRVFVDNSLVWEGNLGFEVEKLNGPVGIRTDNVKSEFELLTPPFNSQPGQAAACRSGPAESE
jgi:hypothetical protein